MGVALLFTRWVPATVRSRAMAVGLALVVVAGVANRPEDMFIALLFFGTMFVGTVVYRALHGELPIRTAVIVYASAMLILPVAFWANLTPYTDPTTGAQINWRAETLTFWAAYGLFAVALLARNRHFPRLITYVGKISYSLYLVHPLVMFSVPWASRRAFTYGRWVAGSFVLAMLTYHLIEQPFQKWGRKLSKRVAIHPDDVAIAARTTPAATR